MRCEMTQACYSRKFVRQFLSVNFAYANSYVRNASSFTSYFTRVESVSLRLLLARTDRQSVTRVKNNAADAEKGFPTVAVLSRKSRLISHSLETRPVDKCLVHQLLLLLHQSTRVRRITMNWLTFVFCGILINILFRIC